MKTSISPAVALAIVAGALAAFSARAELAASPEGAKPLGTGQPVPDVTLKTADGKDFALKREVAKKPAALIFYRGGWCPYCMRHLAVVQEIEKDLSDLGFQVLAISPDSPEAFPATLEKHPLKYTLLSDANMAASEAFGLAFAVDPGTVERYKEYGIKLTAQHDGKYWLPVPAVYLTDKSGEIAFAHTNPDYKKRLGKEELLSAARKVAQE